MFHLIADIVQLISIVISVIFFIKNIKLRKEVNRFIEKVNNDNIIRDERLNLLSRENVKLRTENEMLKERLRDLGIRDFDVIN